MQNVGMTESCKNEYGKNHLTITQLYSQNQYDGVATKLQSYICIWTYLVSIISDSQGIETIVMLLQNLSYKFADHLFIRMKITNKQKFAMANIPQ